MGNFLKSLSSGAIIILLVFLCFSFAIPKTETYKTNITEEKNYIADFCNENEGRHEVSTNEDGSFSGSCFFDDGSSCDDLEFFTKKCKKGDTSENNSKKETSVAKEINEKTCIMGEPECVVSGE